MYRQDISEYISATIFEAQRTTEIAEFTSRLITEDKGQPITVPVLNVRVDEIADTFGAPRGNRTHEGVDIFAPQGTYVVAGIGGIIMNVGQNRLGGNTVYILGAGGRGYYYAHLEKHDSLLNRGQVITPNTILGTVGTSGNAEGTPPHLHFGIYDSGRVAVDPLPLLRDNE